MITRIRSLAKALTWRLAGSTATFFAVLFVTNDKGISLSAALADAVVKIIAYYFHERIWSWIAWGRKQSPLEEAFTKMHDQTLSPVPSEGDPTEHLRTQEEAMAKECQFPSGTMEGKIEREELKNRTMRDASLSKQHLLKEIK